MTIFGQGSQWRTEVMTVISTFDVQAWRSGPCAVVRATGELDLAVAPRLRAEIDRHFEVRGSLREALDTLTPSHSPN
ncbi:hypothetical protein OG884_23000 [Streptosporangium sp. NBC_01755]|uniref:hypothetical protein n=1 Tax=unclassified Streptosporangium TaxID=2632669 RepID=UPI002DD9451C|nr:MULTISPECIES: hypothetical protein [unclassified Streptosporangium]WSA24169.1 hypothetical protein OIE13_24920 [Streptosporangium sp. NBC_01810]WSC97756.1 hypothetical protein OG884_23000 [Streptosporangium sp. NBC_01755]